MERNLPEQLLKKNALTIIACRPYDIHYLHWKGGRPDMTGTLIRRNDVQPQSNISFIVHRPLRALAKKERQG